jgi:hypothetical protein
MTAANAMHRHIRRLSAPGIDFYLLPPAIDVAAAFGAGMIEPRI